MKNPTPQQIEQIKTLTFYTRTKYHGNTKKVGVLPVNQLIQIVQKKAQREYSRIDTRNMLKFEGVRRLISQSLSSKNTPYFKIMIEGDTGIYYASPIHQHRDYNKTRLFDKSDAALKVMAAFNKLVTKTR